MNGVAKSISIKPSPKPHGYWTKRSTHKQFFDFVGESLGVKQFDDWYKITRTDIYKLGGKNLLEEYYNSSVIKALQSVYPEHDWKVFRFNRVPSYHWNTEDNIHEYLDWLSSQLNIKTLDDWSHVSSQQLESLGAGTILNKFGGLHNLLKSVFPDHPWKFNKGKLSKAQKLLQKQVQAILPDANILVNYRHPELLYPGTNREMELDLFVPEHKLAFEYNGEHHYHWSTMFGNPDTQIERDTLKRDACISRGITLIEIPYWWDRSKSQILAEIHKRRPDIVHNLPVGCNPIPASLPAHRPRKKSNRTDTAFEEFEVTFPLLWKEFSDPSGWIASFKVPGERMMWDGKSKFFFGRSKQTLTPPETFLSQMPAVPLDGVVVSNNPSVDVHKILRSPSGQSVDDWNQLHFCVLDAPTKIHLKYKDRLNYLQSILTEGTKDNETTFVSVIKHQECTSQSNLRELIAVAEDQGLEGVIIRNPNSYAIETAGFFVAKVGIASFNPHFCQTHEEDTVLIVDKDPSKGTITCKRFNDQLITFRSGTDLPLNTVVQIAFPSSTDGPLQPLLIRKRDDVAWTDLLRMKQGVNYIITQGKGHPQCRGCNKVFQDKSEWRIEVKGSFISVRDNIPHPVKYTLCIDPVCITRATQTKKSTNRNFFPPFDGRIGVPSKVATDIKSQYSYWDVQWVEL